MKTEQILCLNIVIFFLGMALGLMTNFPIENISIEPYFNSIATLISVFLGAWFAFRLQGRKTQKDTGEERAKAGREALFILYKQNMFLKNIDEYLAEYRGRRLSYLEMGPKSELDEPNMKIDSASLSFLNNTEDLGLLLSIISTDQLYRHTVEYLNERSIFFRTVVMPKIMESSISDPAIATENEVKDALGMMNWAELVTKTEHLDENTLEAVKDNFDTAEMLLVRMSERYSDFDFSQYHRLFEK